MKPTDPTDPTARAAVDEPQGDAHGLDDWAAWQLEEASSAACAGWDLIHRDWSARAAVRRDRRARGVAGVAIPAAIAWLVLAVDPQTASAQMPNLVELSAQYVPSTGLDLAQPREAQISSYQLAINLPIPLSATRFLIPGITYHVDSIAYPSPMTGAGTHSTFHAPELAALFIQLLPHGWSLSVRAGASIASGIGGGYDTTVDRGMLQGNLVALVNRALSDELVLGAGALVTAGFGSVRPLPALSLRWRPGHDVSVDAFVPAFATARYTAWNRVEVGARVELAGNIYAIRDPAARSRWPCAAEPSDDPSTPANEAMAAPGACLDHVTYTDANAGLVLGVRLGSTLWLTTFTGFGFYRHADKQDRDGDVIPGGSQTLPRAAIVRAGLAWRLPGT